MSRIRNRFSSILFCITLVAIGALLYLFVFISHKQFIDIYHEKLNILTISAAEQIQQLIKEETNLIRTLASNSYLIENLKANNEKYEKLPANERREHIEKLNQQWIQGSDHRNEMIEQYTTNEVADTLIFHQAMFPDRYGEIFLTNRYGALVGSTGELTTFAHAHKYWWKGSYQDGTGYYYLDDRGFDQSVNDYVFGIVVPVYFAEEIIGLIKANIRLLGPFKEILHNLTELDIGQFMLVRSNGEVILRQNTQPLSLTLSKEEFHPALEANNELTGTLEAYSDSLQAYRLIEITRNSNKSSFRFGGTNQSIDQHGGFKGEGWYVVAQSPQSTYGFIIQFIDSVFIVGLVLVIIVTAAISYLAGLRISSPVERLLRRVREIEKGDHGKDITLKDTTEIGALSKSINEISNILKTKDESLVEAELLAATDELTHIPNRRELKHLAQFALDKACRYGETFCLLMIDIDHFKRVNDTFGHDTGDEVLKVLVLKILEVVRRADVLARWGGEEFLILLPHTNIDSALEEAERVRKHIEAHNFGEPSHITVSIGATEFLPEDELESMIHRADEALYFAKDNGRNQVCYYTDSIRKSDRG